MSSTQHINGPLRTARLVALSLTWCLAVIAGSTGLNALIKANQNQSRLKKMVSAPTVLDISVRDIFLAGVLATTASTLISVLIFNFIAMMFIPRLKALSLRTLRFQAIALSFCSIWLIAASVPFTLFFATRHAIVRAFVGTLELPAAVIQKVEAASGSTSIYKDIDYLKLATPFPWITLVFTIISAVILFKAASEAKRTHAAHSLRKDDEIPVSPTSMMSDEKASIRETETV